VYPDRSFLASASIPGRIDPRMATLHELEMHRRGEVIRASEFRFVSCLGELEKSCGNTRLSVRVPTAFLVLPNFHSCLYFKQIDYELQISIA